MEQLDLFADPYTTPAKVEPRTLARREDPVTSKLAAKEFVDSGKLGQHEQACLDVVRRLPGFTANEVGQIAGVAAHKRLPRLRERGLVRNGEDRSCSITGKKAQTWEPV